MVIAAYATMPIVPEVHNLRATLERQTSRDLAAAGVTGGRKFGDAAGREASSRFKSRFTHVAREAVAPVAGLIAGAGIIELFKGTVDQAREAAAAGRQTNAVIASTGGVAGVSAKGVTELADALARKNGIDEEAIHSSENLLLTFRNIRNEAGAGNDVFDQTAAAVQNVSTALKRDLSSTSIQVGKALNDPIRGLTALTRIGITFDAQQRGQIKTLVQSGNVIEAQKLILAELGKEFGGAAAAGHDAVDRLGVEFKKLERDAGTAAIPAVEGLAKTLEAAIPAIEHTGGVVHTAAHDFAQLPTPIKDAAKAFLALKIAGAIGLTGFAGSGLRSAQSGLASLRIRAMLTADAYRGLRSATIAETEAAHVFTPAMGRMTAGLGAMRSGATGAGGALRRGLLGATSIIGGAWGAAFIAGTAIVLHFWSEHQKAKQRVDDLTESLDKQTGAITDNTRATVIKSLQDSGTLAAARELGISLDLVTNAALKGGPAAQQLDGILQGLGEALVRAKAAGADPKDLFGQSDLINNVSHAVDGQSKALAQSAEKWRDQHDAMGEAAQTTDQTTSTTRTYTSAIDDARTAVLNLLDAENKRRNAALGRAQDRLALAEAVTAAKKQAAEGTGNSVGIKSAQVAAQSAQLAYTNAVKAHGPASEQAKIAAERLALAHRRVAAASSAAGKTLDITTEAGQKNKRALEDLASQWNNSAAGVRNAKGAYGDIRKNFIDIAESMGASRTQAKKWADQWLALPKDQRFTVKTPDMTAALERLREINKELRAAHKLSRIVITAQAGKNQAALTDIRKAGGGAIAGPGTGTSDSVLMWGSNGEFMQRKAAVDYYGLDFMERLNARQVPKFAAGGAVGAVATSSSSSVPLGTEIRGILSIDRNGHVFLSGVARAEVAAATRTSAANRRRSASDGVRRP